MNIEAIITQMVVLFLLVIAGFVANKCKLMDEDFDKKLSKFVINITCPCLILASVMGDTMPESDKIMPLLGVGVITYIFLIGAGYIIPRFMPVKRDDRGMYSFMLAYANVGFIGYPVVASIFGGSSVFYASILNVPNTLTIFIWGVIFVTGGRDNGGFKWKLLWSPAMIATYLSILIVVIGWRVPDVISRPCTLLGNMTIPSALLVIGSSICHIPLKRMVGSLGTYILCAFRLLILPLSLFYILRLIGFDRTVININTILTAMPVATFGTMFCLRYGRDDTLMSQGTFLSTLLSVLSIPLMAMIISAI